MKEGKIHATRIQRPVRPRFGGLAAVALMPFAGATAATAARAVEHAHQPPRILELAYYQDYEGFGNHQNVTATIIGDATRVTARSGGLRAAGRLSRRISPTGRGKSWFFRDHGFVHALRADLEADGIATVVVEAAGEGGLTRKRCTLELERDPDFGDSANGECERLR